MAEARSAVSYQAAAPNLSFIVNDEEIVLRINKNAIPSFFRGVQASIRYRVYRFRNAIFNAFYPNPPFQWTLFVGVPATIMLTEREEVARASTTLWQLGNRLPETLPRLGRVAIVSVAIGTGVMLALSYTRRFLLRALLGYQGWLYEGPKDKNITTMVWGFLVKAISGQHPLRIGAPNPRLYSNQGSLPRLPVPKLEDTCRRYLASVRPILSEEDFAAFTKLVDGFRKNEGPKLQRYLVLKSWFTPNYVTDWWEKYVYLRGRSPIVINSNYYVLDSKYPVAPSTIQASRAAYLCSAILDFKTSLDKETLKPMMIRSTVPMCMWQYERMFSTTRIPGKEIDTLKHFDASESRHIAVLRRGRWYIVDGYHGNGEHLTPQEMESQRSTPPTVAEASIAALTGEDRTVWANVRSEFFANGLNRQSLDMIERAVFVLSLDHEDHTEDGYSGMARSLFHGDGTNRWCDKSFNLIIFPNGKAGLHAEHSWADAPVIAHMFETTMVVGEKKHAPYDSDGRVKRTGATARPRAPATRLTWDFTVKAEQAIASALANIRNRIEDISLHVTSHTAYGKGFIKKCNVSPDAYIQMALQLAYYRDANEFALTYESSMTRLFLHGRTETVRPVTMESAAFVKAMVDPNISDKERIRLLHVAADEHQDGYREAMTGKGLDRHLFALYVVSQGTNTKSEFLNRALSMQWRLSTSQQPQNQTGEWDPRKDANQISPGGGFGPVADDGYGVSYMVASEDELFFHVSSKKSSKLTDAARFSRLITEALHDMRRIFE